MRRYPFLPPDSKLGWTPYAWLVYLAFFLIEPLFYDVAPWEVAATGAVVLAFLPLYFWGYWQSGPRAWLAVFLIASLGAVSAPWNYGSAVFFIYAAGYLGWIGPPRRGFLGMAGLVAWIAAEAWIFDLPWNFWGIGILFTVLIAGINIHYAEVGRRDSALRRSQEEVQRLARVAERERIGRDLHDLLGHTLSLITLKAELAGKLLDREGGGGAARREVADVERISRRALAEVREAVAGYRSGGLAAELDRAAAALASAGLQCEREVSPAALVRAGAAEEAERVLSFVLREAVTNILRHAGAGSCRIDLSLREGWQATAGGADPAGGGAALRLEVRDDGRGGAAPEGHGLSGMRERLAAVGGSLSRDGNGGTTLVALAPLDGAQAGGGPDRPGGATAALESRSEPGPDPPGGDGVPADGGDAAPAAGRASAGGATGASATEAGPGGGRDQEVAAAAAGAGIEAPAEDRTDDQGAGR